MLKELPQPSLLHGPTGLRIERCLRWGNCMQIASEVKLIWPDCRIEEEPSAEWVTLYGRLPLQIGGIDTVQSAEIEVRIGPNWINLMPSVWCKESWMKVGADWHAGKGGIICYELDLRWTELCQNVHDSEGVAAAARYGATWLFKSVAWLIYRHHYAHVMGIQKWPPEWPFWPHGDEGRKLYSESSKVDKI
jgi:hypothetical protein